MLKYCLRTLDRRLQHWRLPKQAKLAIRRDTEGLPDDDPGSEAVISAGMSWLFCAQDHSTTKDGGVARHFSLVSGWGPSYPETTGYIVPTLIDAWQRTGNAEARSRAQRMLEWFTRIQFPEGGFQGGHIQSQPRVPVTFNTGQILLGLASGVGEFGHPYRDSMRRAATWLVTTQDADGCWRKHPTPFAAPGQKAYEIHVAWGLLEAARLEPGSMYADAALANVRWALRQQADNGWFAHCCLDGPRHPLTHTLGYALRGVVEAYRFTEDKAHLNAARKTADGVVSAVRADGYLPGRLNPDLSPAVSWVCLTGNAQIAHCLLMLYGWTGERRYLDVAMALNRFVRRTVNVEGPAEIRGAVQGSFPIDGDYGPLQYLNWACKFLVDANVLEQRVAGHPARA